MANLFIESLMTSIVEDTIERDVDVLTIALENEAVERIGKSFTSLSLQEMKGFMLIMAREIVRETYRRGIDMGMVETSFDRLYRKTLEGNKIPSLLS